MEVQILYDKESINRKLYSGWGVSFLINGSILFDTGEDGRRLLHNMKKMDIDVENIEIVVISHDHWDHTGGLWEVLKIRKGLKVYICPNFSDRLKKNIEKLKSKIIEAEKVTEIDNDIFITGEIAGEYKKCFIAEQALVAATEKGLTIMTGCSHPGIVKIVEQVKKDFPDEKIYLVCGGFHLIDKSRNEIKLIAMELKNTGIEKVGPTHCSGYNAEVIFKEVFDNNFISIKAGQMLEI
jgi:7,8-dihydropterin-6-yl-methyl-4-(beta-D-ribofuranosyl)aminobenzene 5'-phosphate synthase